MTTTTMTLLEAVHAVDPQAVERARRLMFAASLLAQGKPRREVSGMVWARYECSRYTAWRIVTMAADLTEQAEQQPEAATQ